MTATPTLEFNDFQQRALTVPEELDLFLGGGRGGGKSYLLALLAMRHVEQYGAAARILYIRRTYKGLADAELIMRSLFGMVYGTAARFNAAEHIWRFPNGGYLELGQLETQSDYAKYQGRSFTLLLIDEAGQFPDPSLLDLLRSNLRGPLEVPIRMVVAANPGGPGHHWLSHRYVFRSKPWTVFPEPKSGRDWVYGPSTFAGNRFIDRDQYRAQLQSACPDDPELLRAWMDGDWAVNRGAYFAGCLDENRNVLDDVDEVPWGWSSYLAHDFGSSAPSATYLMARSPGDTLNDFYYPPGSLLVLDELATHRPGNLNMGLGWTVPQLSDAIKGMCRRWGVSPHGVADDAIFARGGHASGSIADEFSLQGVHFEPARKADRVSGWNRMRRLLSHAGSPDRPGLYVARRCRYFWDTVPMLARDAKRIEDVDTTGPDHGADAIRYGCLRQELAAGVKLVRHRR